MNPDVAVLMCVWKGDDPKGFESALLSLLNQEYPSERTHVYLGIDGPLSEDLEAVVRQHQERIFGIVRSSQNIGLSRMLNRLIERLGDEKYVFRMDADDFSLPHRFGTQVKFMDAHPDVDVLGSAVIEIDDMGQERFRRTYPSDCASIVKYIAKANPLAHPSVCMRRDVFARFGAYSDAIRRNQDLELWFRILAAGGKITNLSEPLLMMRYSDQLFRRRQSLACAVPEVKVYMLGIWRLHGFTHLYAYPLARFLMRMGPSRLARALYSGSFRKRMNS